ncbi:MAG: double zinc ribbon domain-containing protein [Burkholderiales bacterium]
MSNRDAFLWQLPRSCFLCGQGLRRDTLLCAPCEAGLPRMVGPACGCCGEPFARPAAERLCRRCASVPLAVDETVAGFVYRYPLDILVRRLKYGGVLYLAKPLADGLVQAVARYPIPDVLLAMPLSPRRQRQRGYNQAHEIAVRLARHFKRPLLSGVRRIRETKAQAGLNFAQRRDNMADAFDCGIAVAGLKIAVVDDVMTSGATMDALARVLKAHGARRVSAWIVARTPSPDF